MTWDEYFYNICRDVGANSKCLSKKIGALIIKNNYIISTGYNGPPVGCMHCDNKKHRQYIFNKSQRYIEDLDNLICPRKKMGFNSGEGLEYCSAAHAERNAISAAARLGHSTEGATMYTDWIIPCFECAKSIINAGIAEIVVVKLDNYEKTGITGKYLLEQAGVKIRKYYRRGDSGDNR